MQPSPPSILEDFHHPNNKPHILRQSFLIPHPHTSSPKQRVDRAEGPSLLFLISRTIQKILWERIALERSPLYTCAWDSHDLGLPFWLPGKGKALTTPWSHANEWPAGWRCHNSEQMWVIYLGGYQLSQEGHVRPRCGLFPSRTPRGCQVTSRGGPASLNSSLGENRAFLTQAAGNAGGTNLCTVWKKNCLTFFFLTLPFRRRKERGSTQLRVLENPSEINW